MAGTIGIVGAGSIVERYYLAALRQSDYTSILIYDIDSKRASEIAKQFDLVSADLSTLITTADIIIVATPPHTHFELVSQLLAPGKTIICEKPFVLSETQAKQLVQTADQLNARLLIAHIRRIFPGIQLAQQYIQKHQSTLGKLMLVKLFEGARFNYQSYSGYVYNHPMGGVLADTGSHVLDSLLYVTGMDTGSLNCTVQFVERDKQEPSHEFMSAFQLNEIPVQLKLSRYEALSNKMTLQYEHAIIEIPLGIKPSIRVTSAHATTMHSAADSCITYFSQAFREELRMMLQQPNEDRFNASRFSNLSMLLETLYNA
ncbi:MAG: Gfo/Idh/MocA family oxidoreductase [Bacteroidota bacterium]